MGRIAAIRDPDFSSAWGTDTGFFGFFECEDDEEAALGLYEAAEVSLRSWGMCRSIGPVALTTNDEVGFLSEGFDSPPRILTPYNPARYLDHAETAGYSVDREYYAFRWTPDVVLSPAARRMLRRAERATTRGLTGAPTVRSLDPDHWDREVRSLHALYNASFEHVWGFVPMTWEEFDERAQEFRQFYRPELIAIAEVDGEPIGFAVVLPDVNAALRPLGGRLLPFGWLRLVRSVPRLRTGRFLLLGVHPDHTGRGIAVLLSDWVARRATALGFDNVELSLVQSANRPVVRVIEAFGCPRAKSFRLYRKEL